MPITVINNASRKPAEFVAKGSYWLALAQEHLAAGKPADAMQALLQAAEAMPLNAEVYRLQALALHAQGQESDALATGMAVAALESGSAVALYNIGTAYFMNRHWPPAEKWYRLALLIDPDLVPANQNLASILRMDGRLAEADRHYDRAYTQQSLFIEPAEVPLRNILILCSSRPGNVPFEFLLPQSCNTLIKWVIEYAEPEQPPSLPHYDLVFNAIGDADTAGRSRAAVERFLARNDKPLLNPPQTIDRTSRDRINALLAGIDHIVVPRVMRWDRRQIAAADAPALIDAAGLTYPVIVRPTGAHGGDGVILVPSPEALIVVWAATIVADATSDELYVSSYHEYRSPDSFYRKYRVIFVDRKPYPYHLAISGQWLAHYVTADMLSLRWKPAEEYLFLYDPVCVLGKAAWEALEAVAQRLDLDFGGVDFSVLPDGKLLIFETNATMLVHPETYNEELKFKNPYVQRILDAFDQLLDRSIAVAALR
jgi:tetratricopeptide (TPR) repeat protein